jgi:aminoglycoside phosphotransferase (APT) family kinase protein
VVKVHHDEEGARAYAALQALHATGLGTDDRLGIARPLGYLPELRMAVQEHIAHERTLKDVIKRAFADEEPERLAELRSALRRVAVGLAAFHTCGSRHGASVSFTDEFAVIRAKGARLSSVVPGLEARLATAVSTIEQVAAGPVDADAPIHHSFRPAQVLLGERVSIIDFDKSAQGEPASDLASLTTKLLHMGANKSGAVSAAAFAGRLAVVAELRGAFVEAYRDVAPVASDRLFVWEALELVSLVLSAAKKADDGHIDRCAELLDRHLAAHAS